MIGTSIRQFKRDYRWNRAKYDPILFTFKDKQYQFIRFVGDWLECKPTAEAVLVPVETLPITDLIDNIEMERWEPFEHDEAHFQLTGEIIPLRE